VSLSYPNKEAAPVAAIILAAGDSRRMERPKALLPFQNTSFLKKITADYRQIGCSEIIVIAGSRAAQIASELAETDACLVINPHPEQGPFSSLKIGLAALPEKCSGFFIHPVDHPAVKMETLRLMVDSWARNPETIVKPIFDHRGGHPLLLGRNWIARLRSLPPSSNLREWLSRHPESILRLSVPDPGILQNVNEPADYDRLFKKNQ